MTTLDTGKELTRITNRIISHITLIREACLDLATGDRHAEQLSGMTKTIEQFMQYMKEQQKYPAYISYGLSISTINQLSLEGIKFKLNEKIQQCKTDNNEMAERYEQLIEALDLRLASRYENEVRFAWAEFDHHFQVTIGTNWNKKYTEEDCLTDDVLSVPFSPLYLLAAGASSAIINILRLGVNVLSMPFYNQEDLRIQLSILKIGMALTMMMSSVVAPLARVINIYGRCSANENIIGGGAKLNAIIEEFSQSKLSNSSLDVSLETLYPAQKPAEKEFTKDNEYRERLKQIASNNNPHDDDSTHTPGVS